MVLRDFMHSVYIHILPNKKVYIGITSKPRPKDRWHKGSGYKNNKRFANAIRKYGWDNIKHKILYSGLTKSEAEKKEMLLIALYRSSNRRYGYNIAKGGNSNYGYHHSEKTKQKIRDTLTGKKHTKERRENQRKASLKMWQQEGHRKKMSEAHKGKYLGKDNACSVKIDRFDLDGNYIDSFDAIREAERQTGIDRRQISDNCRGRQKSCHGYIWKYAN